MTIDQCIARAAQELDKIYAHKMDQVIRQMLAHGAHPDDIDEFKIERRATFESWRDDELVKMREELLSDDGWQKLPLVI